MSNKFDQERKKFESNILSLIETDCSLLRTNILLGDKQFSKAFDFNGIFSTGTLYNR